MSRSPEESTGGARRADKALVVVTALAGLALIWPIYPMVSSYRPTVLGLPLSFAWVILWLSAVFAALVFAFRRRHGRDGSPERPPEA